MNESERQILEVAVNRKARRDYEILDRFECGIVLQGTEVKTLRAGRVSLEEAYVRPREKALWLVGAHLDEYTQANVFNHEPTRERKLLMRKRELVRLSQRVKEKGLTLVPLRVYFLGKWAKLEIGIGRGRKFHDKREAVRKRETDRVLRGLSGRHG
ncbi:MAG TPA: SsrA-binding protein SmpB [Planctomycetota bacterium]